MGRDHHAIGEGSVAGRNGSWLSFNLHETQATTANRLQSLVVTKGRNVDANSARRFQYGDAFFKLVSLAINDRFGQF